MSESASSASSPSFNDLTLIPSIPGSSSCNSFMLAISTSGNQLSVISVRDNSGDGINRDASSGGKGIKCHKVRILTGIRGPQKVCMVSRFKALILTGDRTLKLYDVDHGCLLLKLKGVMNQKMPFFASIDEKNCIALSRNRMTANIMSLETGMILDISFDSFPNVSFQIGDLTTTFKVGEDRFLNSLLVSGNGAICVCGDETQKPFPLLVWDLKSRKLQYDLRLQHHNFLTQFSAISHDAHYVVSIAEEISSTSSSSSSSSATSTPSSSSANFIVVYDLMSGMLFKKWKPGINTTAICIIDKLVINACADHSIMIWDLATGDRKHVLTGHTAIVDTLRASDAANVTPGHPALLLSHDSTCKDPVIRVWNMESGMCCSTCSICPYQLAHRLIVFSFNQVN